jgi:hypothetical protein
MDLRRLLAALLALPLACAAFALPAAAQDPNEEWCLRSDRPEPTEPEHPLRFGITPLVAGNVGPSQGEPVPFDPDRNVDGVLGLRPDGKELVIRLNRMFWADGEEGVQRFAEIVDRYAEAGFRSELQVRYHPPEGAEGDMDAWEDYVRLAARILGARPALSGLSITNEANINSSPNTSDGAYEGVREAIVRGTLAARDELDRMGRDDVGLGFSFAWRWLPHTDRGFWEELGELATPEFLAATDYVGVQIYPGLVWPPAPRPNVTAGEEIIEALTIVRHCYMPKAGLEHVDLWVSENGYATNLGRSEQMQDESLTTTISELHRLSGTLGITDYRWFNLRDNRSDGADMFDAVGLMRDDYSEKPAYATFRELLERYGTAAAAAPVQEPTRTDEAEGTGDSDGSEPPDGQPGKPEPAPDLPATGGGAGWMLAGITGVAGALAVRAVRAPAPVSLRRCDVPSTSSNAP